MSICACQRRYSGMCGTVWIEANTCEHIGEAERRGECVPSRGKFFVRTGALCTHHHTATTEVTRAPERSSGVLAGDTAQHAKRHADQQL
jgi:hypothetical protein